MVDFAKLRASGSSSAPIDPNEIFKRLPKPPHINDLWATQSQALSQWHSRRSENDLVLKLNTGGGKTLVALLILQSLLNQLRKPAVYLCPNNQLVEQTIHKATEIGISAVPYVAKTELPSEFLNGTSILVASYQALFNGHSKFGVAGTAKEPKQLGAIILDDAHAAFAILRQQFSISVSKKDFADLYADLSMRFRSDFEAIGKIGSFDDIVERGDSNILEVPYWAWRSKAEAIRKLLATDHADDFGYQLPLLRDSFDCCHALISSRDFLITPILPLVHLFPSFIECKHRIYMSATIADDSSLVRTFDANPKSVSTPIIPETLAGVGERMILAPALIGKFKESLSVIKTIVATVAKKNGVVILVPSENSSEEWKDIAHIAKGEAVAKAVQSLISGDSLGPYVFPNRYDGIDLPGKACRLIVLHGLPLGSNTYDLYRAAILLENSSINVTLAQRVEQGIGRGTRGAGDYCVILLSGNDLLSWISQRANLNLMTPSTRTQVLIGHDITKALTSRSELLGTINQCLERDKEWTRYHAEQLADRTEMPAPQKEAIAAAVAERHFLRYLIEKNYEQAISSAREYAEKPKVEVRTKGWILFLAAKAALDWGKESLSTELHKKAFAANKNLMPPKTSVPYETVINVGSQAKNIVSLIQEYGIRWGCVTEFSETISWLTSAATSNQFEESMKRLAKYLGFVGQRPEHDFRIGPDVLWLIEHDYAFILECKNRKEIKNSLTKEEHGQLLTAEAWFATEYPEREAKRMVVHPNSHSTEPAVAEHTFALTFVKLNELIATIKELLSELCGSEVGKDELEKRCASILVKKNLTYTGIASTFLTHFETVKTSKGKS